MEIGDPDFDSLEAGRGLGHNFVFKSAISTSSKVGEPIPVTGATSEVHFFEPETSLRI